jgi:hypothetical protein
MPSRVVDPEQEQAKRELRLRIGRLRRRINSRVRASEREGRRLLAWRTYVIRYPVAALAAAFGVGLALSGSSGRGMMRSLGLRLAQQGTRQIGLGFWRELADLWTNATPGDTTAGATEGDHGRV